jgi:hypothetical protein
MRRSPKPARSPETTERPLDERPLEMAQMRPDRLEADRPQGYDLGMTLRAAAMLTRFAWLTLWPRMS